MKQIYANLLGNWVELTNEDGATIMNEDPSTWIQEQNLHEFDFIWVGYRGRGYKIHVSQVQILN
ncbi:hypothetical protein [Paenibacillus graminis]|uniref:hypothetical protein n=1 Tax=Paenibacillus graminis TaxID=189425 RepID=UPI002DB6E4D9|nr:hypothetical protein [Paenibacillus graminis]MEC0173017.1 hypothetical protein [Paenibacillus graminis]